MKKLIVLMALMSAVLTGCASSESTSVDEASTDNVIDSAILLVPGNLGDQSYYDSANRGMGFVEEELGIETTVVEMTSDATKWEPNFLDAIDGDFDIIISGGDSTEKMYEIAEMYPEQKFINYDVSGYEPPSNVYSMEYKTNELSFLVGAVAAMVTTSDLEYANPEHVIGFVGGMDIPGINDFLVGYIEGAKYVDPEIKVLVSYAGDFEDPAKGKELALNQYNNGADVIFNVAGGTGLGIFDAAKDLGKYAIGVDSDQEKMFTETDPEKASLILTSGVKSVDYAILGAMERAVDGTLPYGTHESLGLSENAVQLAKEGNYQTALTDEQKATIEQIELDIINGDIEIDTAYGKTSEEISAIIDSVQ